MSHDDATLRQIEAADPGANTWLSANAGSGKTRVLTNRVARLLLTGVSPQNILCLTYTKAAASEMQNRLFGTLGEWAMMPAAKLHEALDDLGVTDIADLAQARRLFAAAIETPGGLKIQTIHSFCGAILRRFPLEAGVSPQFQEMDDRSAKLLQAEILDDMAMGPNRPALDGLARFFTDQDFTTLTAEITRNRGGFFTASSKADIWHRFDLAPGFDETALAELAFAPGDAKLIADLRALLATGSASEQKAAAKLAGIGASALTIATLPTFESVFLTGSGAKQPFSAKIGSFPTKATRDGAAASLMTALDGFMARIEAARPRRLALDAARKTLALHRFAHPFVTEYEARKQARGWLDFDDLILRAGALLNDPGLAAWVLYRLDGGIDHILVDEAQDTSPDQWRVIESLAREFTTGESARSEHPRTLFVVGDMKQSIYSFQGADPSGFTRMQDQFEQAFGQVGATLHRLELEYSFRSAPAILRFVDYALEQAPGLGREVKHIPFDDARPGRVDLWPVVEKQPTEEPGEWTDPVDMLAPTDAPVTLANDIAEIIARMLESGTIPRTKEGGFRPITPGDVLVLVRRRSDLFHQIIRACKARGLPIAGADRLRIGGELAVKDLTAVLSFLATPEDDLSLAAALRSPLFGLDEDALFRLAHGRGKSYLWNVLRKSGHTDARTRLEDLRNVADYLRPYELIDRILTRHDGRRRLTARLGPEAEDGIDALLAQALAYESIEVPSLTGFLTWLAAEEVEIKRQMDSASDQIRVMTVHGAKGLEAPIVILPDTGKRRPNDRNRLIEAGGGMAWKVAKAEAPPLLSTAADARAVREHEESMRLLYVAMTRAESWLIIAAAGDAGKPGEADSWYRIAEAGMEAAGGVACDFNGAQGKRYETGDWASEVARETPPEAETVPLPAWAERPAPAPEAPPRPLVPSDLGGAKIVPAPDETPNETPDPEDSDTAKRHGRQLHRLLEFLPRYPREDWPDTARALLAHGEDAATETEADVLLTEAAHVLDAPELAPLFAPGTLAEVEISAPVSTAAGTQRIHGIIDRLIVTPDKVTAVDFKTNRTLPPTPEATPEGILRQMGTYERALAEIYPDRAIVTAILWTRTAQLTVLPTGVAARAFSRLDVERHGS
ncbi:MAG: double-strand break repair helicase AddA [Rhodobacterales bacterium]|nr:MAG: double-strand break repair helicase AddA [Rhodobacterales bacterium]